ncbi:Lipoprotein 28 precursor [Leclercia adecarboxylata]|uniref:Lipoprotein 28 n=1 Tax=Leclercia adecarboxylata TaxID=83655 RepID=A0A4U9HDK2_9ENTR|nr:Lipoprotein 28 precursor [Leclercia adecarboxylata]
MLPTSLDITANPKKLNIMELEGAQLPRVLDDPKVDVAIISTTYLQQTGLSPVHDSVFIEDKNSPYVNIVVAREDNKEAENVKEFVQAYQSPEVAKAAETIFNGGGCAGLGIADMRGAPRIYSSYPSFSIFVSPSTIDS